jgi:hypothetical protein
MFIMLFRFPIFGRGSLAGTGGGTRADVKLTFDFSPSDFEALRFIGDLLVNLLSMGCSVSDSSLWSTSTPESSGLGLRSGGVTTALASWSALETLRVSWKLLFALVTAERFELFDFAQDCGAVRREAVVLDGYELDNSSIQRHAERFRQESLNEGSIALIGGRLELHG